MPFITCIYLQTMFFPIRTQVKMGTGITAISCFVCACLALPAEGNEVVELDLSLTTNLLDELYAWKNFISKTKDCYKKYDWHNYENATVFDFLQNGNTFINFSFVKELKKNEIKLRKIFLDVQCFLETIFHLGPQFCKIPKTLLISNLVKEFENTDDANVASNLIFLCSEILCRIKKCNESNSLNSKWFKMFLVSRKLKAQQAVLGELPGGKNGHISRNLVRQRRDLRYNNKNSVGSFLYDNLDIIAFFFASTSLTAILLLSSGLVAGPPGPSGLPGPVGPIGPTGPAGIAGGSAEAAGMTGGSGMGGGSGGVSGQGRETGRWYELSRRHL